SMPDASARSGDQYPRTIDLRRDHCAGGDLLRMRRTGFGMQHQSTAYWADVRHGDYPNDFFWLHLLSLERSENFSHPAKTCAHQPAGICKKECAPLWFPSFRIYQSQGYSLLCFSLTFCCWLLGCGSSRKRPSVSASHEQPGEDVRLSTTFNCTRLYGKD